MIFVENRMGASGLFSGSSVMIAFSGLAKTEVIHTMEAL